MDVKIRDVVICADPYSGTYVGQVESLKCNAVQVKILFCLAYPSQWAVFNVDNPVERHPYAHLSTHGFLQDQVQVYSGPMMSYGESIMLALNEAMKTCRKNDEYLMKHYERMVSLWRQGA